MIQSKTNPFTQIPLVSWYPGHMTKANREIKEKLRLIDLAVELLDARVPRTSRNPQLSKTAGNKPRCVILTKEDLADPEATHKWIDFFQNREKIPAFPASALNDKSHQSLLDFLQKTIDLYSLNKKQLKTPFRPVRIMILGIPNIGKSSLINRLAGGKKAKIGPRPGVTRSQQWVRLNPGLELLDTPGILQPQANDKAGELKLGLAGTIKDEMIGEELLVDFLLWWNQNHGPKLNFTRYGIDPDKTNIEILLEAAGKRRGLLQPGGKVDPRRAAASVLHEFREGKLGRITLDPCPEK